MLTLMALALAATFTMQTPQAAATPGTPDQKQAEASAKALLAAFVAADAAAMKEHFADKVQFIGDPQFLNEPRGRQVQRDLTRDQMTAAYARMFETMDRTRWAELGKVLTPTLTRVEKTGGHREDTTGILPVDFVKAGEFLYELKAPGSGLDDVILFVLRPVAGKWQIVAHWADY